ncbi:MAG: hypothetical protein MUF48_17815, partial [Pirellulaceae bacterium]|nr:hypothetical protein [Pirellulaceae bacterium]
MPIDFPCSVCGQMLRVGDDASGRQARCPNCQSVMTVPGGGATPAAPEPAAWNPFAESPVGADASNPYAAPQPAA